MQWLTLLMLSLLECATCLRLISSATSRCISPSCGFGITRAIERGRCQSGWNLRHTLVLNMSSIGGGSGLVGIPGAADSGKKKNPADDLPEDAFGAPLSPLPSVPSTINYGDQEIDEDNLVDLWIVGAGTLGTYAVTEWVNKKRGMGTIVAETRTESRHEELRARGAQPRLRSNRKDDECFCARNVLICIPPSAHPLGQEYALELYLASRLWAGSKYGALLFTSSTVVYGDASNTVTEKFRTDSRSNRSLRMIAAEEDTLKRGGSIMRLAGLYTKDKGPHTFWLKCGEVESNADGMVNLIHYEDAASAVVTALLREKTETIYLASDEEPVSRENICKAAVVSSNCS